MLAIVIILGYFYITDKAIRTNTVTLPGKVITKIDTVDNEVIIERWKDRYNTIIDTVYRTKPETLFVAKVDSIDMLAWKEWVVRLAYEPPHLEFTSYVPEDSIQKHYIYDNLPWGFLLQPEPSGKLSVQIIDPPKPPQFSYDYGWGAGYELDSGPAVYGLAHVNYKQWKLNLIATVHVKGLRGSLIVTH